MALFIEIKKMQSVSPLQGTLLRRYNGNCELLTTWDFADCKETAVPPRRNCPGDIIRQWDDSISQFRYYERIS